MKNIPIGKKLYVILYQGFDESYIGTNEENMEIFFLETFPKPCYQ